MICRPLRGRLWQLQALFSCYCNLSERAEKAWERHINALSAFYLNSIYRIKRGHCHGHRYPVVSVAFDRPAFYLPAACALYYYAVGALLVLDAYGAEALGHDGYPVALLDPELACPGNRRRALGKGRSHADDGEFVYGRKELMAAYLRPFKTRPPDQEVTGRLARNFTEARGLYGHAHLFQDIDNADPGG